MAPLYPVQVLLYEAAFDSRRTPAQQVEAARRFWLSVRWHEPDAELDQALTRLSGRLLRISDPRTPGAPEARADADRLREEMAVRLTRPSLLDPDWLPSPESAPSPALSVER